MYSESRQIGAVGALILLLLGPSFGNLSHMHEVGYLELFMHKGAAHVHASDHYAVECFLCSFSFPTFQMKEGVELNLRKFSVWKRSPSFYVEKLHFPALSSNHSPRAPPYLHRS